MKKNIFKIILLIAGVTFWNGCNNYPIDEDGLLISERTDCYVGSFTLLDTDLQTIIVGNAYVDTLEQVIIAYVRFGAPIDNLWPQFSLGTDMKLSPKITSRIDFTLSKMNIEFTASEFGSDDLSKKIIADRAKFPSDALKYTVISGNRKIRKEYTILIVERKLQ
ncbi:MAG: hypothetical protein LBC19_07430 [Tannerella sp.]|nr:hypothetical protein [Tannerella sp.]